VFPADPGDLRLTVLAAIVRQNAHPEDYLFLPDFTKSRNAAW